MKRITTISIITAVICIALAVTLPIYAFRDLHRANKTNAELAEYVTQLEIQLNIKNMQVKDLQDELTGVYQELENIRIEYFANMLFTEELQERYRITKSYANQAQRALTSMGYDFRQVIE